MKNFRTGLFVFAVTGFLVTHGVFANPTNSPSAKAAALLKNHPPAGWINHYLGDDRYKIAGNVWKVVSTPTDHYFHRPECPEMLRRSPDNVIGFASVTDAEEAGYLPDPSCRPDVDSPALSMEGGGAVALHAVQVRLADGRSTVTLPAGWRKAQSQRIHQNMFSAAMDMFTSSKFAKDGAAAVIITVGYPGQIPPGALTAAKARQYMQMYHSSGYVNSEMPMTGNDVNLRDATFKGMSGVLMTPKSKARGNYSFYMLQKGSRQYIVGVSGKKSISATAKGILNSYRPR